MSLVVQTNVSSLVAQKNLSKTQAALQQSFARLSSGYRINSAADDAAGLAISTSMDFNVRSYAVAERNANDGVSMAQTAEGTLGEVSGILGRMRELAMQSSNGSLQTSDRAYAQTEFVQLQHEVTRIQAATKFNGKSLIQSAASAIDFQVGINNAAEDKITITFGGVKLSALILSAQANIATAGAALTSLSKIDAALATVSTARGRFGSAINRLDITTSNLQTVRTNTTAAVSRIRDVDVAEETSKMSRTQVLQQAGAAILAQANSAPQVALSLLR
jgi:flagellin